MLCKESTAVTGLNRHEIRRFLNKHPNIFVSKNQRKKGKHDEWAVHHPDTGERLLWPSKDSDEYYGKGRELAVTMTLSRGSGEIRGTEGRLFRDILYLIGMENEFPSILRSRNKNRHDNSDAAKGFLPGWLRPVGNMLSNYDNKNNEQVIKQIERTLRLYGEGAGRTVSRADILGFFEQMNNGHTISSVDHEDVLLTVQLLNLEEDRDKATKAEIYEFMSDASPDLPIDELEYVLSDLLLEGDLKKDGDVYSLSIPERFGNSVNLKLKKLALFLKSRSLS